MNLLSSAMFGIVVGFISCSSWSQVFVLNRVTPIPDPVAVDYVALCAQIMKANLAVNQFNQSIAPQSSTCSYVSESFKDQSQNQPEVKPVVSGEAIDNSVIGSSVASTSNFESDANPNTQKSLSQGCLQASIDILETCYQPISDQLKKGSITIDQLRQKPHEGFRIRSHSKDASKARQWDFHHENRARQDVGLSVMDGYHYGKGSVYAAEMMFFPRTQIPQYVTKGDLLEVTLANGEVVNFDSSKGRIKSGVLTENKPIKGKKPDIKYQGNGVMIQMIGLDGKGRSYKETALDAFIYKKGFKPCKVPVAALWPDHKLDKANNFKFATDEGLDKWLKQSKCGFNLY